MAKLSISSVIIFLILTLLAHSLGFFSFKRYTFRKKSGNERRYRLEEERCRQQDQCQLVQGLQKDKCIRICISKSCYDELYSWNELEEGEIDVRLTSFKGCVVKQVRERENQKRREQL